MNNRGKKQEIVFDITTTERGGIEVNVSIPHQDPKHTPGMTISTADIISYLNLSICSIDVFTRLSFELKIPNKVFKS